MQPSPIPFVHLHDLAAKPGGGVVYMEHEPASVSLPLPPRFLFGACNEAALHAYFRERHIGAAGLYIAADIDLYAEALLFRDSVPLACSDIHMNHDFLPGYMQVYQASGIRRVSVPGKCVLLLGPGHTVYGHYLVDFLPKLYMLHLAGYQLSEFRYMVPSNTPDYGLALLELLGITADRRVTYEYGTDLVTADILFIPTMARHSCRTSPLFRDAARFARDLIWQRNPMPPSSQRRIYVSRGRVARTRRTLANRAEIEAMAERAGFAVVHPEDMPLIEQFALFRDAEAIIGEYGSALHASIFSEHCPIVCALQGAGPNSSYLQSGIGHAMGQPTGYVFGPALDEDRAFRIEPDAFGACLDLVFGGVGLAT